MKCSPCAFLFVICGSAADLRQDALHAIFPGMDVVATTRHRNDGSNRYPDALASEPIFQVNGPAANEEERCASEDLLQQRFSRSREVRVLTFPWPGTRADVLAVVQYRFIGSAPAGACWSIGLLAHLTRRGRQTEVVELRLIALHHHSRFLSIRLLDLTANGAGELVVEPDWVAPARTASHF